MPGFVMYYRRPLNSFSAVYSPFESKRFMMMTMGGYWPVIQKLPDGNLGVVTRDSDFHVGQRGRLVFLKSNDGGESWSHAKVVTSGGLDNRNPAFGITKDGEFLVAYIENDRYEDGLNNQRGNRGKGIVPIRITRSTDGGDSWETGIPMVGQGKEAWSGADLVAGPEAYNGSSPFGKMLTSSDGTIFMTYYHTVRSETEEWQEAVFMIKSKDGGHSWVDPVTIAEGFNETSLCDLGSGRIIAVMRESGAGQPGQLGHRDEQATWQSDSFDDGNTWSVPRQITGYMEHPADIVRLNNGKVLLTYGRRSGPFGIQAVLSEDGGETWRDDRKLLLVADGGQDQGYPSTVQRDDGMIVTVYYSSDLKILGMPSARPIGIHGASLIYNLEHI